eukprot:gene11427-4594_t
MKRFVVKLNLQNEELESKLNNSNFTKSSEIIETDEISLSDQLDISLDQSREIIKKASQTVIKLSYPNFKTVFQIGQEEKFVLKTGLKEFDESLFGGIPSSSVTEIVSANGLGKTQLMHTLAVQSLAAIPNSSVLYLDTNLSFSADRFLEICQNRQCTKDIENFEKILSSIFKVKIEKTSELTKYLDQIENFIIEQNVKLIILDSIASLVERESNYKGIDNIVKKQDLLSTEIQKLKFISDTFKIPIIVTNFIIKDNYVALGNTFHHAVNIRIRLDKTFDDRRFLKIEKSAMTGNVQFEYFIDESGFNLKNESDDDLNESDEELLLEMEKNYSKRQE